MSDSDDEETRGACDVDKLNKSKQQIDQTYKNYLNESEQKIFKIELAIEMGGGDITARYPVYLIIEVLEIINEHLNKIDTKSIVSFDQEQEQQQLPDKAICAYEAICEAETQYSKNIARFDQEHKQISSLKPQLWKNLSLLIKDLSALNIQKLSDEIFQHCSYDSAFCES